MQKIKVGISACLLGHPVRFNGAHKNAPLCSEVLSQWFDFVPICPEVEIGMGVPREPIHLVAENHQIRVKNVSNHNRDYTSRLDDLVGQKSAELSALCGYILMQKSPSCGLYEVKVHDSRGKLQKQSAMGVYAYQLQQNHPLLPMEEVKRLNDRNSLEHFMTRVFANYQWRHQVMNAPVAENLLAFHQSYQLLMRTHSRSHYQQLSALVAAINDDSIDDLLVAYHSLFTEGLSQVAKPHDHVATMMYILRLLKDQLPVDVEASIVKLINGYQQQKIRLTMPVAVLKYYVETHNLKGLSGQKYLEPYPFQLGLSATL